MDDKKKAPSVVQTDEAGSAVADTISQEESNTDLVLSQDVLSFYSQEGLVCAESGCNNELSTRFHPKKERTYSLADSYARIADLNPYGRINEDRVQRVMDCGGYLVFAAQYGMKIKLVEAHFCKDRLCPMCSWRRSLKSFSQLSSVIEHLNRTSQYEYCLLTLTIRNCSSDDISSTLDQLFAGFRKLLKNKRVKVVIKGYFKSCEITRNLDSIGTDLEWHPHLHVIIVVNKSYFKKSDYISQKDWIYLWRDSLGVDYDPSVRIQKIKVDPNDSRSLEDALNEVSKYVLKSDQFLEHSDPAVVDSAVEALFYSLFNRRLTSFGGVFKQARKDLKQDDPEDGDLIHIKTEDRIFNGMPIYMMGFSYGRYGGYSKVRSWMEEGFGTG